jgi:exonuclease SbcC
MEHENVLKRLQGIQELINSEEDILARVTELEAVKGKINAIDVVSERAKDLSKQRTTIYSDIAKKTIERNTLRLKRETIEEELKHRDELQAKVERLEPTKTRLKELEEKNKTFNELAKKKVIAEVKLDAATKDVERIKKQLARDIADLNEKTKMLSESNCVDIEKAACVFLADARCAEQTIKEKKTEYENIDMSQLEQARQDVETIKTALGELGYSGNEHENVSLEVARLQKAVEELAGLDGKVQLLTALVEQENSLNSSITELTGRVEALGEEYDQAMEKLKPYDELKKRRDELEPYTAKKEELMASKQIQDTCAEQAAGILRDIEEKNGQKEALEKTVQELEAVKPVLVKNEADAAGIKKEINDLRIELQEHSESIGALKIQLNGLEDDEIELKEVKANAEQLANESARLSTLVKAFGMDGIPFGIVRAVVPELRELANRILWDMTGGNMSMDIHDQKVLKSNHKEVNALEVYVTDAIRGTLPYLSRSGGQKVKAALAMAFALADLKARRAGIQLGMIFVDEPPFLDDEGKRAYCNALEMLATKYEKMKVVAISHEGQFKARFPQIIEVTDNGEAGSKARLMIA